jgi:hypothetical protein
MCAVNNKNSSNEVSGKQLAANRANAVLSTGPRTREGKAASSRNAVSHGLSSTRLVVFEWESQEELDNLTAAFHARFLPLDQAETRLVNRLVDSTWRRNRIISLESTLFDLDISNNEPAYEERFPMAPEDGILRMAIAFRDKHGEGSLLAIQRYLTSVEGSYSRASRELEKLQKDRFNCLSAAEIVAAANAVAAGAGCIQADEEDTTPPPSPEPASIGGGQVPDNTQITERTHFDGPHTPKPSKPAARVVEIRPQNDGNNSDGHQKHHPRR